MSPPPRRPQPSSSAAQPRPSFSLSCLVILVVCPWVPSVSSTASHAVLQIAPCSKVNTSVQTCISTNNCSGRERTESCVLVISVPAEDSEVSSEFLVKPTQFEVWTVGGCSVGLVSLSGIVGALMWPAINSPLYRHMMRLLIGLALGSLTSTALFQLIPEGFMLKEYDSSQGYLYTSLFAWGSVWSIYLIESISKILFSKNEKVITSNGNGIQMTNIERDTLLPPKNEKTGGHKKVAAVAWMVILGDGLHNFIDGMSIGAGYTQSIATGIGLSLGIAAEEFPHELGDFAILVQSGMPVLKALAYNFLSACTAFLGFGLGVVLGQIEGAQFIFSFAAGLFLYISLTHLIPELKEMLNEDLKSGRRSGFFGLFLQNVGIISGTVLIFFITKYNDDITSLAS